MAEEQHHDLTTLEERVSALEKNMSRVQTNLGVVIGLALAAFTFAFIKLMSN